MPSQLSPDRLLALPLLERLTDLHPLREDLRSQMMVALYRSGRQADACAVFTRTREILVEELGIEPSPSLQNVFSAILRQDQALTMFLSLNGWILEVPAGDAVSTVLAVAAGEVNEEELAA